MERRKKVLLTWEVGGGGGGGSAEEEEQTCPAADGDGWTEGTPGHSDSMGTKSLFPDRRGASGRI